jgi:probable rRNA maturation factor
MKFYLINNSQWPVSQDFVGWLLKLIEKELPQHKTDLRRGLGVVVASLPQMIDLNGKFRKKKGATDVLSFEGNGDFLGDVVICQEILSRQAKDHGLDESEEFAYLLLHGLLHLLGYEHETKKSDALKMFAIQDKIFEILMDRDIFKAFRKKPKK